MLDYLEAGDPLDEFLDHVWITTECRKNTIWKFNANLHDYGSPLAQSYC